VSTTTKSRKQSPTVVDLGRRPSLAVEHEARGRCLRSHLYGEFVEIASTGDVARIEGSYWGPSMRLIVTLGDLGDVDAREVKLLGPWPLADGSQQKAEYRDAVIETFLREHPAGKRIVDKLIAERGARP
jgi:hypothetical protein